jgi:hypothetical protein
MFYPAKLEHIMFLFQPIMMTAPLPIHGAPNAGRKSRLKLNLSLFFNLRVRVVS